MRFTFWRDSQRLFFFLLGAVAAGCDHSSEQTAKNMDHDGHDMDSGDMHHSMVRAGVCVVSFRSPHRHRS